MTVVEALQRRYSARAFLPDPVALETVRDIVAAATQSPSGGNVQPWHVQVLTGAALKLLKQAVAQRLTGPPDEPEYDVYPAKLAEPYRTRRFECGEDLYAALDIPRSDRAGRLAQFAKNMQLFDAPVGLFFSIDRVMGPNQWAHLGMFMQSIMLAALDKGLDTCAQEAWSQWHVTVAEVLQLPPQQTFYCGMALGVADSSHPINQWRTQRAPLGEVAQFLGFPGTEDERT